MVNFITFLQTVAITHLKLMSFKTIFYFLIHLNHFVRSVLLQKLIAFGGVVVVYISFLFELLRQNSTTVMSFCVQQVKVGDG